MRAFAAPGRGSTPYLVVDEKIGIVFGVFMFNHPGKVTYANVKGVGKRQNHPKLPDFCADAPDGPWRPSRLQSPLR